MPLVREIKVIPNARKNEIISEENGRIKVKVTAPPVDGKANRYVKKLLARHFNVAPSLISIVRGEKNSIKIIEIDLQSEFQ